MVILALLALVMLAGPASASITVLAPPPHVSTQLDRIHIVGTSSHAEVEVLLNGAAAEQVSVRDSVFHVLLRMPCGLNEIMIRPVGPDSTWDADGSDIAAVTVMAGPEVSARYQRFFEPYVFHGDEAREDCLECHTRPLAVAEADSTSGCLVCHTVIRRRFRTHITGVDRPCDSCHQVSSERLTGRERKLLRNPCYDCHRDKIEEFTQDYVHGPVAGEACVVCHDPHGSVFAHSLQSPVPLLCMSCHPDADAEAATVRHAPFDKGQCTECHDPHATSNRWVLVRGSRALCQKCHQDESMSWHNHPYDVKPRHRLATNLKLTNSGELECLSCHDPHATMTPHLLRSNQANTCQGCHPEHR